ncbi:MAG: DciA family protein [Phycisphaerae bacterium]
MIFPRKQSGTPSRRRAILEEEGLEYAPLEAQQAFWKKHNLARRSIERRSQRVGELIASSLSGGIQRSAEQLRAVSEAWKNIISEDYRERCRVDYLDRGRLYVSVDCHATGFLLQRRMHDDLLAALNARLSKFRVRRIEFRAGTMVNSE